MENNKERIEALKDKNKRLKDKFERKLNSHFQESVEASDIEIEFQKPYNYELIFNIINKKNSKKICSIVYIPDGNYLDGENQQLEERDFDKDRDSIDITPVFNMSNSYEEFDTFARGIMRARRLVKNIEQGAKKYIKTLKEYKKIDQEIENLMEPEKKPEPSRSKQSAYKK